MISHPLTSTRHGALRAWKNLSGGDHLSHKSIPRMDLDMRVRREDKDIRVLFFPAEFCNSPSNRQQPWCLTVSRSADAEVAAVRSSAAETNRTGIIFNSAVRYRQARTGRKGVG